MKKLWTTIASLFAMFTASPSSGPAQAVPGSAYDFEFTSIDGKPMPLSQWRGKPLLIVNTASFCGYTKQYAGLQDLWKRYEAAGLVVVGVPSNDFGGQEPKNEKAIKTFCEGAYGITFPLTTKQTVVGDEAHPFFKWAISAVGEANGPQWNFHKYLIGRDGKVFRSISTKVDPSSPEMTGWIEKAIAQPAAAAAGN